MSATVTERRQVSRATAVGRSLFPWRPVVLFWATLALWLVAALLLAQVPHQRATQTIQPTHHFGHQDSLNSHRPFQKLRLRRMAEGCILCPKGRRDLPSP